MPFLGVSSLDFGPPSGRSFFCPDAHCALRHPSRCCVLSTASVATQGFHAKKHHSARALRAGPVSDPIPPPDVAASGERPPLPLRSRRPPRDERNPIHAPRARQRRPGGHARPEQPVVPVGRGGGGGGALPRPRGADPHHGRGHPVLHAGTARLAPAALAPAACRGGRGRGPGGVRHHRGDRRRDRHAGGRDRERRPALHDDDPAQDRRRPGPDDRAPLRPDEAARPADGPLHRGGRDGRPRRPRGGLEAACSSRWCRRRPRPWSWPAPS